MDYPCLNCWGLVRLARHELFGMPLLPESGCAAADKRCVTQVAAQILDSLSMTGPQPGALATCWRGRLCLHVGLVIVADGRMAVMDIDEGRGLSVSWLHDFERRHQRVEYWT